MTDTAHEARADWEARIDRRRERERSLALPELPAPEGLQATPGPGQVTLNWDPVEGAAGYLVERSDARDGDYEPLEIGEPVVRAVPHPPLTDTTGTPGRPAWYRVAAVANVEDHDQPRCEPVKATPLETGAGRATIKVDAATVVEPLPRPWRPMIGSEHLSQLFYTGQTGGRPIGSDFAAALRMARQELGVEAVRAHAILHDELGTYREVDGVARYDFTGIDRTYDRVLEIGLRPIVEISFMPRDLASDPSKTVFDYDAIVSPPRDWDRWEELVRELAAHLVDRYGLDEVRHWGFEVWNEANLEVFWSGTRSEYMELYDRSVRAVRSVNAELLVGGPATAAVGWIDEILDHVNRSGAPIDFLSTHTYGQAPLDLRPISDRHGHPGLREWWTEWGAHASHFNEVHDSPWSAAYLVRGMKSAMGRIEALAYWVISDHFEELGRPPSLLHGGFGLLSVGNLRKPRWWGLWMLEQLGAERLSVSIDGDGAGDMVDALATSDPDGRLAVLAWNVTVDVSKADGDPRLDLRVEVALTGLTAARYRLRHRRLDERHSNLVTAWHAIADGRDWPDEEGWRSLRESDRLEDLEPERELEARDGSVTLAFDLPMPAISFLELTPAD
jgi:xylan 1,4-beta-xylosidase